MNIEITGEQLNNLQLHEYIEEPMQWHVRYRIIRVVGGLIYQPINRDLKGNDTWLTPIFVYIND